jgi:AraC-like DNA-binding protein
MIKQRPKALAVGRQRPLPAAGNTLLTEDRRIQPLLCIPAVLNSFGVKLESVARKAGFKTSVFEDPNARVAFVDLGRLLLQCADATDCPHFGLVVGQRMGLADVEITGILARHSETVGHALRVIITHLHLYDRGAVLSLRRRGEREVELAYLMHHPDTPGARHIVEGALASLTQAMRNLAGPRWAPTEVILASDRPPDTAAYRKCFCAPVRFNTARFALIFRAHWLDRPIAGADAVERHRAARLVTDLERSQAASTTERSREVLAQMLVATPPSVERVARALGVSRRTLNRDLEYEGTTFKSLLEDARCALARQLLVLTCMPVGDIATALHYTTMSSFSRAFTRWHGGESPRRFRERAAVRRRRVAKR